jgi:CheY-like chemotaxis protein
MTIKPPAKPKLLIVEDDEGLCSQYRWAFPACDVLMSHARHQAVTLAQREGPPVVLMDLGLPPDPDGVSEGFATLSEILRIAMANASMPCVPSPPAPMISAKSRSRSKSCARSSSAA